MNSTSLLELNQVSDQSSPPCPPNSILNAFGSNVSNLKNVASLGSLSGRKRRRAPAHLAPICLSASSQSGKINANGHKSNGQSPYTSWEGSSDSLIGPFAPFSSSTSNAGSDDDCQTPDDTTLQVPFTDDYDKRLRLSTNANGSCLAGVRASPVPPLLIRGVNPVTSLSAVSGMTAKNAEYLFGGAATGTIVTPPDDCYDLAELECGQTSYGSIGVTNNRPAGGLKIGDGTFELVGDGRDCKGVNVHTQAVYQCQVLKTKEYHNFMRVADRLQNAANFYDQPDLEEIKNLIIPSGTEIIRGDAPDIWYILSPDHFGNLHTLVHANLSTTTMITRAHDECRIQPIFKQIVTLLRFCHSVGIYFRDFRLRKFVFVDKNRTRVRLHSALDVYVAASADDDRMAERHVCPAYVAPEILEFRNSTYAGRPADIWALGVMLFVLLTNHYPFYDQNHSSLFRRIRTRRLSFAVPERISPNARWLFHALLRLDPMDRPCATDILHSHWLQSEHYDLLKPKSFQNDSYNESNQTANDNNDNNNVNVADSSNSYRNENREHSNTGIRVHFERSNPSQSAFQLSAQTQIRENSSAQHASGSVLRPNRTVASFHHMQINSSSLQSPAFSGVEPLTVETLRATACRKCPATRSQPENHIRTQTPSSATITPTSATVAQNAVAQNASSLQQTTRRVAPTLAIVEYPTLMESVEWTGEIARSNNFFDQIVPDVANASVTKGISNAVQQTSNTFLEETLRRQFQTSQRQRLNLNVGRARELQQNQYQRQHQEPTRRSPQTTLLLANSSGQAQDLNVILELQVSQSARFAGSTIGMEFIPAGVAISPTSTQAFLSPRSTETPTFANASTASSAIKKRICVASGH